MITRTYGTFAFSRDGLGVKVEPVAATRFKRVFERAHKSPAEWIYLSATPENARELAWFMERYPLEPATKKDARRLKSLGREFERLMNLVTQIAQGTYVPPDVEMAEPARDYQLIPAAMLDATGGVLLGDDVGLGKTVSTIVAMARPGGLPALVVTKTDLPKQYEAEINRFLPSVRTYVLKRAKPVSYDSKLGREVFHDLAKMKERGEPFPDVVITSYSKIEGWAEFLVEYFKPQFITWDEVQEFRAGLHTLKGRAGAYLAEHAKWRIGASATPIHNYGDEIHPVMEVIAPGALGTREEFTREWCGEDGIVTDSKTLGLYLRERGIYVGRSKADVGRELPALTISRQYCAADPGLLANLKRDSRAVELAKFVLAGKKGSFQSAGELNMLIRSQTGIAKAPYVAGFVSMLLDAGEPVVLFGFHHGVYDLWKELLKDYKPAFFTGRETQNQKQESLRRFKEGETKLLIISLRAGAGLDGLQYVGCSNVVFGELDWSPAVHIQAIGRVNRDGNDLPVTAWYLVADVGSDPTISDALGIKMGQLRGIRNPSGGALVEGQADPDAMKRLARNFLEQCGAPIPEPVTDTDATEAAEFDAAIPLFADVDEVYCEPEGFVA